MTSAAREVSEEWHELRCRAHVWRARAMDFARKGAADRRDAEPHMIDSSRRRCD
jgi:hypothetical protein